MAEIWLGCQGAEHSGAGGWNGVNLDPGEKMQGVQASVDDRMI